MIKNLNRKKGYDNKNKQLLLILFINNRIEKRIKIYSQNIRFEKEKEDLTINVALFEASSFCLNKMQWQYCSLTCSFVEYVLVYWNLHHAFLILFFLRNKIKIIFFLKKRGENLWVGQLRHEGPKGVSYLLNSIGGSNS